MKRSLKLAFVSLVAVLGCSSPQRASACSRIISHVKVRRDFEVIVKSRDGKVLEGVPVTLRFEGDPAKEVVQAQTTDKGGNAFFRGLMVSNYWISVERGGVSASAWLWTVNDESGESQVTITWPEGPISKVQHVSGHLLGGEQRLPLPGMKVWLTDTISGKEIGRIVADQKGTFAFQVEDPGLYVLHIEDPQKCERYMCKIEGRMLIEVDPNARDREFPRYGLMITSCGLAGYKDDGSIVFFEF